MMCSEDGSSRGVSCVLVVACSLMHVLLCCALGLPLKPQNETFRMSPGVCCADISAAPSVPGGLLRLILFYCGSGNEKHLTCQSNFQFEFSLGESASVLHAITSRMLLL